MFQIPIEQSHDQADDDRQQGVGRQAVLQCPSGCFMVVLSEKASHDGRQSVAESRAENDGQVEHVVHETGCGQFLRAVVPDHQGIGKPQYDDPNLSDDDGDAQPEKRPVVGFFHGIAL